MARWSNGKIGMYSNGSTGPYSNDIPVVEKCIHKWVYKGKVRLNPFPSGECHCSTCNPSYNTWVDSYFCEKCLLNEVKK